MRQSIMDNPEDQDKIGHETKNEDKTITTKHETKRWPEKSNSDYWYDSLS